MGELSTQGFHHITMVSSDAARTLRFYRDILGLGLVKRTVNFDDPGAYHLYFGDAEGRPGTILTFFEWPAAPRGRWGVGGVHHLALTVEDEAALLRWKRWLNDRGVSTAGPYDRVWFTSLYFSDPDGQVLELATRGPGYTVDEPMETLGEREIVPRAAHLRGGRDEAEIAALTHPEPIEAIEPGMRLDGIHHISGITREVKAADEFLGSALGLRRVKRSVNQDSPEIPHWFWASYDGGSVAPRSAYTLFGWPMNGREARGGVGQTHHIAFRARDAEEQLRWREHLLELGVEVSPVLDRTYFQSIYFRAPDGQLMEIATDGPGFTVDEEVEHLGSELKLPAWLEGDRERIRRSLAPLG